MPQLPSVLLLVLLAAAEVVNGVHGSRGTQRYCEPRLPLLADVHVGSPVIVAVPGNASVALMCNFCGEEEEAGDDAIGAVWRFDALVDGTGPRPAPLRPRRAFLGDHHELVLRKVTDTDMGLYSCNHLQGLDRGRPFQYFLDLSETRVVRGSPSDWRRYRDATLRPLSAGLRRAGVILEASTAWGPWGPCANCSTTARGRRERVGACRLRVPRTKTKQGEEEVDLGAELRPLIGDPWSALPCRSTLLAQIHPNISALSENAPDFVEVDDRGCDGDCYPRPRRRLPWKQEPPPPVPRMDVQLEDGDDLTLVCPGATLETAVRWEHDGMALDDPAGQVKATTTSTSKKRRRHRRRKAARRPAGDPGVRVDWSGALRMRTVSAAETGLYTCFTGTSPAMRVHVKVRKKQKLTLAAVSRHALYLFGVILLCLLAYLTVVAIACRLHTRRPANYRPLRASPDSAPDSPPAPQKSPRRHVPLESEDGELVMDSRTPSTTVVRRKVDTKRPDTTSSVSLADERPARRPSASALRLELAASICLTEQSADSADTA